MKNFYEYLNEMRKIEVFGKTYDGNISETLHDTFYDSLNELFYVGYKKYNNKKDPDYHETTFTGMLYGVFDQLAKAYYDLPKFFNLIFYKVLNETVVEINDAILKKPIIMTNIYQKNEAPIEVNVGQNIQVKCEIYSEKSFKGLVDYKHYRRVLDLYEFFETVSFDLKTQGKYYFNNYNRFRENFVKPAGDFLFAGYKSFKRDIFFEYLNQSNYEDINRDEFYDELKTFLNENIPTCISSTLGKDLKDALEMFAREKIQPINKKLSDDFYAQIQSKFRGKP